MLSTTTLIFAANEPARGAAIGELLIAGAVGAVASALLLVFGIAHRRGKTQLLTRLADFAGRVSGLPGWAALPTAITGISLVVAVYGFYWDVATHIDDGRDAGPFANIAHYPILFGLAGIALGGVVGVLLGTGKKTTTSLQISRGWYAPRGALLMLACGGFALLGFPLDDVWHRLFGQDVTLWGPTHVLMVGGASLSTLGVWVLLVEGLRESPTNAMTVMQARLLRYREVAIAGGFILGLSTLQGEFDFGVPQFQLIYQPILIALAAGIGLVAARIRLGRGGALAAVGFFLALRLVIYLALDGIGHTPLHFPLYIAEALIVEGVALLLGPGRNLRLGVISGALIGTVGTTSAMVWSQTMAAFAWPDGLLLDAMPMAVVAGISGGMLGAMIGQALCAGSPPVFEIKAVSEGSRAIPGPEKLATPKLAAALAAAGAIFVIAYPLPKTSGDPVSATVSLQTVDGGARPTAKAVVRIDPPTAAENADWLQSTAWQGGGLLVKPLVKVGPGTYESADPLPIYGDWKTVIRIQHGRALQAMPIYMPADTAIPAEAVPAAPQFTRPFVRDSKLLQREAVGGSAGTRYGFYGALLAIVVIWMMITVNSVSSLTVRKLLPSADAA